MTDVTDVNDEGIECSKSMPDIKRNKSIELL